jgi:hypothetical protein
VDLPVWGYTDATLTVAELDDLPMDPREPLPIPEAKSVADLRAELAGQILGVVASQAVYAAARLGIPDLLAEGPRSATELAVAAGADPDALYRLLRLLAGRGIFIELAGGVFTNSASSELLREGPYPRPPAASSQATGHWGSG